MTVNVSTIEGFFKTKYASEVERAVPNFAEIQSRIPFSEADQLGQDYRFPVFLTRSHGVTFNGSSSVNGTAYTLNDAVSPVSQEALVQGMETTLREKIAYKTLTAAKSRGDAAFDNAMAEIVLQVKESAMFYQEMAMLYGQSASGIGAIQGRTNDSGTSQTFQITKATWAPGLWAQMENAYCDVWDDDYNPKRNAAGTMQVTAVNTDDRTVTFLGTEAEMDTIVANDIIVPRGWISATTPTWECMAGLKAILENTGTLFSISASTYNLWKANRYNLSSVAATSGAFMSALVKAASRGLSEPVTAFLSLFTWVDLMNDLSALRRYVEKAGGGIEQGSTSIKLYGPNKGSVELVPHPMMMAGEAHIIVESMLKRIGSQDTTFKIANASGQSSNMWVELADSNGAQIRCYSDQAIIGTRPARFTQLYGITNSSLPDASTEI